MTLTNILDRLHLQKDPAKAIILARFFKTGKGEYGEGDRFLGLTVPKIREAVRLYWREISLSDIEQLMQDKFHELRLTGLLVLVKQYNKGDSNTQKLVYDFYLSHLSGINNWDLVDLSAPNIVGEYLLTHPRQMLYELAISHNLWHRRIAILSTFTFIRHNDFKDALKISGILLDDEHDLIHKAVGWMLREIGKRESLSLTTFLDAHALHMPRTMLRYYIEKLSPSVREHYLSLKNGLIK